jgi:hypothetical protein
VKINSADVIYTGVDLVNSEINTNDNLTLALAKLDAAIITVSGAVPNTRTITINGVTQDLSANRTWNTITLASLSGGTGINYNNVTGVITNSAPDQTVTLTQGANITITGSYPNFTIAASGGGGGGLITASQGLTAVGTDVQLGGTLTGGTLTTISSIQDNILGIRMNDATNHGGYFQVSSTQSFWSQNSNADTNTFTARLTPTTFTFEYPTNTVLFKFDGPSGTMTLGGPTFAGASRTIQADGSASNVGINIFAKGTGTLNFATSGTASFSGVVQTNVGGVSVTSGTPLDNNFKGNNATGAALAAGRAVIIGGQSSVTGVAGGDVIIDGGDASVGVANGGNISITSGAGIGGGTPGAVILSINHVAALSIDRLLNIYPSSGTTGMTDGFIYIPSAAGIPTGVPTGGSNVVPMYYDKTNNNFYIYNGSWKKVALT